MPLGHSHRVVVRLTRRTVSRTVPFTNPFTTSVSALALGTVFLRSVYGFDVITAVLGTPGSGKSAVVQPLRACLREHVILDWDALMDPASALAGRGIRPNPDTWPAYTELIRAVIRTVVPVPVVLLGVCTPAELQGWPIDGGYCSTAPMM
jgi:hypothetical protein